MATTGKSSVWIVPWPWPSVTVAPVTFVTFTKNVSSGSTAASPLTTTENVYDVWPEGMVWPVRVFAR